MADIVKALALVVHIAAAWVRFPAEAGTKMDIGMDPCTEDYIHFEKNLQSIPHTTLSLTFIIPFYIPIALHHGMVNNYTHCHQMSHCGLLY